MIFFWLELKKNQGRGSLISHKQLSQQELNRYVYFFLCMYVCRQYVHVYCMNVYVYSFEYIYICIYIYVFTYIHIHMHIFITAIYRL